MPGVTGLGIVGDEDARLQPIPLLLPNPSQFEFGFLAWHDFDQETGMVTMNAFRFRLLSN
jgi:hypothetical protein